MNSQSNLATRNKNSTVRKIARMDHPAANCIEMLESRTLLAVDLALSVVGPASVTAGTDATYTFTTVNNGKTAANGIKYTVPVGYPSGASQVSFTSTSGPATLLKPGQSQVYTLVLAVDSFVQSATILSFPVVVGTNRPDANPTDNSVTITTPVTASADLNLVVTGPAQVTRGTPVTFTFSTFNAGPSTETTGLYTPPSGFPAGVSQLSYTLISGPGFALAPGDQDVYALVMSVSPNIANGTVISFPAVLTGGVPDPNAANNNTVVSTTVVSQTILPVSIALTSSTFNSTSTLGQAVSFTAAITPLTAGGATPTGTVTFTSDGTTLGTVDVQSDGTAKLPATAALTGGNHTIIASYSGNSTYVATTKALTQVVTTPVLSTVIPIFGKIVLPIAVVSGAKFKATLPVGLTNNGSKQSGIFTVKLFANTSPTFDGNEVLVAPPLQKHLTMGTNTHAAFVFHLGSLPASLPAGKYYLLAQVTDANTKLNSVATTQTITTAAPFVALTATAGPVLPATINVGRSGTFTLSVTNGGNIDAIGALSLTLAPSSDDISPEPGVTLATLVMPRATIKAGKTAKYTLHFKHTALMTAGSFFPYATFSLTGISTIAKGSVSFTLA